MRSNPPWANRALKQNWDIVSATARERNLPLPTEAGRWKFEELGCGHYGCVIPTSDEGIVFKLTSDPTEAEFIQLAEPLGWPEGIVRYYAIVPLDFTYRKRDVFAIWREEAYNVGNLNPPYGFDRNDYEMRERARFARELEHFKDNAARFRDQLKRAKDPSKLWADAKALEGWAWDTVGLDDARGDKRQYGQYRSTYSYIERQRGAHKLAASFRACAVLAETMEYTYLSDLVGGAFSFYLDNGFLLADVHWGNVGQVKREDYSGMPWVITDPGHVVVLS